ncbi:MAG: tetratricopeptide repeat protein [Myxococcota bacterium]
MEEGTDRSAAVDDVVRVAAWLLPPLAAAILYAGVLEAGFAYDDPVAVSRNPLVDGRAPWTEAFTRNFWGDRPGFEHLASWRPLTVLSLRMDHRVGEGDPRPFHRTNLVLHLLAVLLTLAVALRVGLPPPVAMAVGMMVAVHPAFSEAVTSVVGRGDLLAGALALAGLRVLHRSGAAAAALLGLALLSKETAVVAVAAAVVLALLDRRRAVAAVLVLLVVGWYAARASAVGYLGGAVPALDNPLAGLAPAERLPEAVAIVGRYVGWWVVPQPIAADYGPDVALAGDAGSYVWLGGAALLGLAVAWVLALRRGWRAAAVGLTLAGAALVLLSNALVVLPTPLAGRLAWWPGLGLSLALGGALAGLRRPADMAGGAAVGIWLVVAAPVTLAQVSAWQGDAPLFATSMQIVPDSVKTRLNHARQRLEAGAPEEAAHHLRVILDRRPDHRLALLNLALALERLGRHDAAWEAAKRAVEAEKRPGRATANLCALGLTREEVDPEWLVETCRRGARAVSDRVEPAVNLARALARAGLVDAAEAQWGEVSSRWPDAPFATGHRVGYLVSRGRLDRAISLQRRLVQSSGAPRHTKNLVALLLRRARSLAEAGRADEACRLAREARDLAAGVDAVAKRARALCPDL